MTISPNLPQSLHFDIHASVVFQLGESLISDVVQALVELVKNSYDADATYANVAVDTKATKLPGSAFPDSTGYIRVEDNGSGMDADTIRRGWLTISNSQKRDMKAHHRVTAHGRTPLGDKGLGRLGVQRLGYNVEIFTRPEGSETEYHVAFSWREFVGARSLSEVPVLFEELPATRQHGTTLLISDLRDADDWIGPGLSRLQTELSQMISPYRNVRDFVVTATVNGTRLDLAEITEQARSSAQVTYAFEFDGETITAKCRVRLDYMRPGSGKSVHDQRLQFKELVEKDEGRRLFDFLAKQAQGRALLLQRSDDTNWYVELHLSRKLTDIDKPALIDGKLANPGPFNGEIDYFSLNSDVDEQSVFDSLSEFRQLIKNLSGIRVYRDGFGIRVDRDWLKLSRAQTSGSSFYGLRPENTLGYVAISAKNNAQLEEKTDREGFKVTPYYTNFYSLLQIVISFSATVQGFLRRGWLGFRDQHFKELGRTNPEASPEELSRQISSHMSTASSYSKELRTLRSDLEAAITNAQLIAGNPDLSGNSQLGAHGSLRESDHTRAAVETLRNTLEQARLLVAKVEAYLDQVAQLEALALLLSSQVDAIRTQLQQFYETTSLGLTAEALSHEILHVADQLAYRTRDISQYISKSGTRDSRFIAYIEYVNTAVAALRKQLAHLSPSLRYVREKREEIKIEAFIRDIRTFYKERLAAEQITIHIRSSGAAFVLFMNKGKLIQIVDNLILNSEYWLKEDIRRGYLDHGMITIEIARPSLLISDNGRGIDTSVEHTLFEPFVTTKASESGRGLGLFIVRQLMDTERCDVSLLPVRNAYGRRYIFDLDFTGAIQK